MGVVRFEVGVEVLLAVLGVDELVQAVAGVVVLVLVADADGVVRREARGREREPVRAPVRLDRGAVYGLIERVNNQFPVVDILVNNAGTILRKPAAEYPDEYWDKIIEINLSSQFVLTREFGRRMLERGSGKVIFTASLLTFQGGITVPSYAASKGGVGSLVKAFANEWAAKGVNVNAIAPGYIATDNTAALQADPVRNQAIVSRIPAGRWGEPSDFKGATVFLASRASDYVHGEILVVDGGWMGR